MSLYVHKSVDMLARMNDFQLLHADEALIVVDKPPGLPTQPSSSAIPMAPQQQVGALPQGGALQNAPSTPMVQ